MLRTAAALSSPGADGVSEARAGSGAGLGSGVGLGLGSGLASGWGSGSCSGLAAAGSGLDAGLGAADGRVNRTGCSTGSAGVDPAGMDMSSRVSIRSTRCSSADSVSLAEGNSSRAHTTSSSSRGAVAPRISPSPACTTSA